MMADCEGGCENDRDQRGCDSAGSVVEQASELVDKKGGKRGNRPDVFGEEREQ